MVGLPVGFTVGSALGFAVGFLLGFFVGSTVGREVGGWVGGEVGGGVGRPATTPGVQPVGGHRPSWMQDGATRGWYEHWPDSRGLQPSPSAMFQMAASVMWAGEGVGQEFAK